MTPNNSSPEDNDDAAPDNDSQQDEQSTNSSSDYGHRKQIRNVFSHQHNPFTHELEDALQATDLLTDDEATDFTHDTSTDHSGRLTLPNPFETDAAYRDAKDRANDKVSEALWICELFLAYRHPPTPTRCLDCGKSLGGDSEFVNPRDEDGVRCIDCADIDPHADE